VAPVSLEAVLGALARALGSTSPVEAAAAILGIAYVVLMIGQHRACWIAGGISTAVYLYVFARAGLYMQAMLQAYYVLVSVYGWWAWRGGDPASALKVARAGWRLQLGGLAAIVLASLLTGAWLARATHSSEPYLDSLSTWASVFATWLAARKKLDSWLWWFAVDALIALLCWQQQLYAAMIPYILYLGLVIIGWRSWNADMKKPETEPRAGTAA
jgi:nicotinamide mononucleotide transporter